MKADSDCPASGSCHETPVPPGVLRTPDERFHALPDFAHQPQYAEGLAGFGSWRLHYVDVAQADRVRGTALCLHGQRCWSYSYRKLIPALLERGYRVIAPDFFGFGRSDKPRDGKAYSFSMHRNTILAFADHLNLENCLVVGHDWGGWFGATLPLDRPGLVGGLLLFNCTVKPAGDAVWPGFHLWRAMHSADGDPEIGAVIARDAPHLTEGEIAAYDAPFPHADYKSGVRCFPSLVPCESTDDGHGISERALEHLGSAWEGPAALVAGALDPVLGPKSMTRLAGRIRNARLFTLKTAGAYPLDHGTDGVEDALAHVCVPTTRADEATPGGTTVQAGTSPQ